MFGKNEIVGKKFFRERPETTEDKMFVTSMFMTLQGEGPYRGQSAFFIRLAKCNLACSFCFVAGTNITLANGSTKHIEDIIVGDQVRSWDETTGIWSDKVVTKIFTTETEKLVEIYTKSGKSIVCTPEHPVYAVNRAAFTNAEYLDKHDSVLTETGPDEIVEIVNLSKSIRSDSNMIKTGIGEWVNFGSDPSEYGKTTITTYNFEVEDTHTYVANGILVHNCDTFFDDGDWLTFDQIEERIETTIDEFYKSIGMGRPNWTNNTQVINVKGNEIEARTNYLHKMGVDDWQIEAAIAARGIFNSDVNPEAEIGFSIPQKKKMVLVMTGGEPMLQDNIGPFLERMEKIFANTQIESNGTQPTEIPASTTLVVSPKCAEKNNVATKYLKPRQEVLDRADCLKFVMEATDGSPYAEVPAWAHEWSDSTGKQIFVSPMNEYNDIPAMSKKQRALNNEITIEERSTVDEVISFWEPGLLNMELNQKNHEYAAQYCVTHGFVLNLQIHLYASLA